MPTIAELAAPTLKARRDFMRDRDHNGRITYMAHAKGHVMTRRPGCIPFVLTEKEWWSLPMWTTSSVSSPESPRG